MQFFDENGKPCSPLIVEGANIFITKEARQMLYDKGSVPIVKDSSANKVYYYNYYYYYYYYYGIICC